MGGHAGCDGSPGNAGQRQAKRFLFAGAQLRSLLPFAQSRNLLQIPDAIETNRRVSGRRKNGDSLGPRHGTRGLGEAYMDGWWDCDRIDELFCRGLNAGLEDALRKKFRLLASHFGFVVRRAAVYAWDQSVSRCTLIDSTVRFFREHRMLLWLS